MSKKNKNGQKRLDEVMTNVHDEINQDPALNDEYNALASNPSPSKDKLTEANYAQALNELALDMQESLANKKTPIHLIRKVALQTVIDSLNEVQTKYKQYEGSDLYNAANTLSSTLTEANATGNNTDESKNKTAISLRTFFQALEEATQEQAPAAATAEVPKSGTDDVLQNTIAKETRAKKTNSALIVAIRNSKSEDIIEDLIENGADLNAQDEKGNTALMYAAHKRQRSIVQLLIENGAGLNQQDNDGTTALMHAAKNGYTKIAELLIKQGADVTAANKDGKTALMHAAEKGHKDLAELLMNKGADVTAANKDGKTAFDYAVNNNKNDIATIIAKRTKKISASRDASKSAPESPDGVAVVHTPTSPTLAPAPATPPAPASAAATLSNTLIEATQEQAATPNITADINLRHENAKKLTPKSYVEALRDLALDNTFSLAKIQELATIQKNYKGLEGDDRITDLYENTKALIRLANSYNQKKNEDVEKALSIQFTKYQNALQSVSKDLQIILKPDTGLTAEDYITSVFQQTKIDQDKSKLGALKEVNKLYKKFVESTNNKDLTELYINVEYFITSQEKVLELDEKHQNYLKNPNNKADISLGTKKENQSKEYQQLQTDLKGAQKGRKTYFLAIQNNSLIKPLATKQEAISDLIAISAHHLKQKGYAIPNGANRLGDYTSDLENNLSQITITNDNKKEIAKTLANSIVNASNKKKGLIDKINLTSRNKTIELTKEDIGAINNLIANKYNAETVTNPLVFSAQKNTPHNHSLETPAATPSASSTPPETTNSAAVSPTPTVPELRTPVPALLASSNDSALGPKPSARSNELTQKKSYFESVKDVISNYDLPGLDPNNNIFELSQGVIHSLSNLQNSSPKGSITPEENALFDQVGQVITAHNKVEEQSKSYVRRLLENKDNKEKLAQGLSSEIKGLMTTLDSLENSPKVDDIALKTAQATYKKPELRGIALPGLADQLNQPQALVTPLEERSEKKRASAKPYPHIPPLLVSSQGGGNKNELQSQWDFVNTIAGAVKNSDQRKLQADINQVTDSYKGNPDVSKMPLYKEASAFASGKSSKEVFDASLKGAVQSLDPPTETGAPGTTVVPSTDPETRSTTPSAVRSDTSHTDDNSTEWETVSSSSVSSSHSTLPEVGTAPISKPSLWTRITNLFKKQDSDNASHTSDITDTESLLSSSSSKSSLESSFGVNNKTKSPVKTLFDEDKQSASNQLSSPPNNHNRPAQTSYAVEDEVDEKAKPKRSVWTSMAIGAGVGVFGGPLGMIAGAAIGAAAHTYGETSPNKVMGGSVAAGALIGLMLGGPIGLAIGVAIGAGLGTIMKNRYKDGYNNAPEDKITSTALHKELKDTREEVRGLHKKIDAMRTDALQNKHNITPDNVGEQRKTRAKSNVR